MRAPSFPLGYTARTRAGDIVFLEFTIGGQHSQVLGQRLRDQKAIEGISVMEGKS